MLTISSIPLLSAMPVQATVRDVRSGRCLNRNELADAVLKRADHIAALGLLPGDRVVVAQPDPIDFLQDLFAAWALGLCAVAVNPGLAPTEKKNVAAATGAKAWLDESGGAGTLEGDGLSSQQEAASPSGVTTDAALIMMTSGTTGVPKGVVLGLQAIEARLALNLAAIGPSPLRQSLCILPVFFGHGLIGNCLTPLAAGATLYLFPAPQVAELSEVQHLINTGGITFMSSVPTFWKMMLRLSPPKSPALERVHIGSAPLSYHLWREVADWTGTPEVYNMFGMTETANWFGGGRLDDARGRDGYVGEPWGGVAGILAEDGGVQPHGRGEVVVQTPARMLGFWGQPDLSEAVRHGRWMRTGDVGEIDLDGGLTLVGRLKSEINRAGIKVMPEEVDLMLERHPDVADACSLGLPDPLAGEIVAAAIVMRPGAHSDPAGIIAWCREQIRAEAVPSRLFVMEALPRNDRGKVARSVVRDAVLAAGRAHA